MNVERKVTVGALVGAFGVIAVFGIQTAWTIAVPAEVAMAAQLIVVAGVQYWVANK
jgi:hypothetical protein